MQFIKADFRKYQLILFLHWCSADFILFVGFLMIFVLLIWFQLFFFFLIGFPLIFAFLIGFQLIFVFLIWFQLIFVFLIGFQLTFVFLTGFQRIFCFHETLARRSLVIVLFYKPENIKKNFKLFQFVLHSIGGRCAHKFNLEQKDFLNQIQR